LNGQRDAPAVITTDSNHREKKDKRLSHHASYAFNNFGHKLQIICCSKTQKGLNQGI